jgi:spermidine/putrescine transport system permease protein
VSNRRLYLAPAAILLTVLFLAPLAIMFAYSLMTRGVYGGQAPPWTIDNYVRVQDGLYLRILLRSLRVAVVSTAVALLLAFPLALFIARSGRRANLYLQLVMLPFWTSFLVRTYAWMFLLRDTGLINTALLAVGIIREPLPLLYNEPAVVLGLVYGYLPFLVLPIYATLEKLDPALLEAAADLGANEWRAVWRVVLPLARPGILAGCVLVFIACLGAYLTPDLLGGGKSILAGNLIQNQFTTARDWPFGAAASFLMMSIVMALVWFLSRRSEGDLL